MDINQLSFNEILNLKGQIFRQVKNRITKRITINSKTYIIKIHDRIGIIEYLNTIIKGKKPVVGAISEKKAIESLKKAGIRVPNIISYYQNGVSYFQRSWILLEDLGDCYTLEDWINEQHLGKVPSQKTKQKYIYQVASIARKMHQNNIVHRDFYLCHFLKKNGNLILIDLHRCQNATKDKIIKDLGALLFSTEKVLSKTDLFRFIKNYQDKPLRQALIKDRLFWQAVFDRSLVLHNRGKKG